MKTPQFQNVLQNAKRCATRPLAPTTTASRSVQALTRIQIFRIATRPVNVSVMTIQKLHVEHDPQLLFTSVRSK